MHDLEMEIGRMLGASAFFIYQTIKHNPQMSLRDLEIETGLCDKSVKTIAATLLRQGVISRERKFLKHSWGFSYKAVEEKETWKFH